MTQVVVNSCWGGFGLSKPALMRYWALKGVETIVVHDETFSSYDTLVNVETGENLWDSDIERDDPILVAVVEEMGEKANGSHARLRIADVPDDVAWTIEDYDGRETVEEVHRSW